MLEVIILGQCHALQLAYVTTFSTDTGLNYLSVPPEIPVSPCTSFLPIFSDIKLPSLLGHMPVIWGRRGEASTPPTGPGAGPRAARLWRLTAK